MNDIYGIPLDVPANCEIRQIVLWAPLDVDYNRIHPKHGREIAKRFNYRGDRIKYYCRKLIDEWQRQYDQAVQYIKNKGECSGVIFYPPHPWIGIMTKDECRNIMADIMEWQRNNSVADGCYAKHINNGIFTVYIWVDF